MIARSLPTMRRIYLDNAATTPMDPEVFEAMLPYLKEHYGNPSAIHAFGRRTRAAIEQSRRKVAALLNCAPGEIIFTSCGTESDNMVLHGAVRDLGVKHIITSHIEHHAIELTAHQLGEAGPARVHWLRLDPEGRPDLTHLADLLKQHRNVLVSLMHANNELGTRIDLEEVGRLCRTHGALFHSDTVQTMGHYPMDLSRIPIDFLSASAHKFHGPKGVGFLFVRAGASFKPMLLGGSQERNMRAGTENISGIVGQAKALEIALRDVKEHEHHIRGLKELMKRRILEEIPGAGFNGDTGPDSLYTVLNVRFPDDGKGEMLIYNLDIEGIACSGGSACSSGSNKGSHVLAALYPERPGANIRFSFSRENTAGEVEETIVVLKRILAPVQVRQPA